MANPNIVRNELKIKSAINNAIAFKKVVKTYGSFSNYIWGFVDFTPLLRDWSKGSHVPSYTDLSKEVSNDKREKGFKFFGPTICYAYMQAMGLVNLFEKYSVLFRRAFNFFSTTFIGLACSKNSFESLNSL